MMRIPMMVELCAGTAALSLRLARSKARPPVSRMGSKAGYADAILSRMGLHPGQGADHYLLCEPDDGCRLLLEAYRDRALAQAAAEHIRGWKDEEPRALWERLRKEGPAKCPPVDPREVARWQCVLGSMWVHKQDGRPVAGWMWCPDKPHQREHATRLATLPTLPATITDDARTVDPPQLPTGSWVYIDPPYVGTTGYGHSLGRPEVIGLARRWREAGAHVAVSEAEPIVELIADGWHTHELTRERVGQKRTFSKQQREVLTMSRVPAGQMGLWGGR